ncbi:class II aldolase/adducin family protein [Herbiconiux sp.]|uniref:class II aldolase/adducin family protein n=1 Tax=Herbiconiux sp. TaxID=1871186 RepID=UPI0025C39C7E|nr:class II aldolase/adducin family protein [Herbiconiux sp.]
MVEVKGGFGPEVEVGIARLRAEVAGLHTELTQHELAVWTEGSVSGRVSGADLFVIKPAGIAFAELAPENMILCTLDGEVVDSTPGAGREPAADTAAHAHVYRAFPAVGGIAHTHSPYATAWAVQGEPIPCVTTSMAAEFGGEIPLGPLVRVDGRSGAEAGDAIGRVLVESLRRHAGTAVLMKNHGPYTTGPDARAAVKSAVLLEHAARVAHLARQLGELTTKSLTIGKETQ